jgi:hypothetical protein
MSSKPALATLPLALLLLCTSACLENEETVEVRADGSVRVTLRVAGDPPDLAGGYNLPLSAPWAPANENALAWSRRLGADTGSASVVERAATMRWEAEFSLEKGDPDNLELSATADLASVNDWPRFTAPGDEPYRSAYLERSASLTTEDKGDRIVYTFERVYHGRPYAGFDLRSRFEDAFPVEIKAKLDGLQALTDEELGVVAGIAREEHARLFRSLARQALEIAYTRGSASLPAQAGTHAAEALEAVAKELFSKVLVADLWNRLRAFGALSKEEQAAAGPSPMETLDVLMRERMRAALGRSLAADGASDRAANDLLYGLEWSLTQYDHSLDLSDEKFRVNLTLPGTIVAGNYDQLLDGVARWQFETEALHDRDVVMRAISVLPK